MLQTFGGGGGNLLNCMVLLSIRPRDESLPETGRDLWGVSILVRDLSLTSEFRFPDCPSQSFADKALSLAKLCVQVSFGEYYRGSSRMRHPSAFARLRRED